METIGATSERRYGQERAVQGFFGLHIEYGIVWYTRDHMLSRQASNGENTIAVMSVDERSQAGLTIQVLFIRNLQGRCHC